MCKVIHAFNEQGFSSLDPDYRGGRPKKTTPEQRDQIVAAARARPDTLGVALTRWSLAKLSEHLAGLGIELCEEALRQTLRTAGLSHQRTRSWKWSPNPEFADKAQRVLGLYRSKPADGVVVCFEKRAASTHPYTRLGVGDPEAARAAARDLLQAQRRALPVRRLRRPCRPAARPAARPQERRRGARVLPADPHAP